MRRRAILIGAGVLAAGGCLGDNSGNGTATASGSGAPTGTPGVEEREAIATLLRRRLEDRGLTVREITVGAERIEIRVQTTGDVSRDIQIVSGVYATEIDVLARDLGAHVEDRGLYEARFRIERAWARRFADGRMSDAEYLRRINETRPRRRRR
jgi:hypothetical protein